MKLLIYGFGPYKEHKNNITTDIIKKLKDRQNLTKIILPVTFNKTIFLDEIKRHKPSIILGMGQHPRAKKIRIERKSINQKRYSKEDEIKQISKYGPEKHLVNLKLKKDDLSRITYNAGDYVCNYSMYIITEFCKVKGLKFAFIHIPKRYDLKQSIKFIETKIDEITQTI